MRSALSVVRYSLFGGKGVNSIMYKGVWICLFFLTCTVVSCVSSKNNSLDERTNGDRLLFCVIKGDFQEVQRLINEGADVNYQNSPLRNGTLHANQMVKKEDLEILKYLLDKRANVNMQNSEGSTPLKHAVVGNRVESIKILLKYGADTEIKDRYGNKAIDYITAESDTAIKRLLRDL